MPSPVVMASALATKTERVKTPFAAMLGIRDHPQTLAEEHAMIDRITGGRLISGMVRGLGLNTIRWAPTRRLATNGSTKPTTWS